jgi:hypothetical protein
LTTTPSWLYDSESRRFDEVQHVLYLLTLIAALSATPLRQAEAAADFARSLSDSESAANIEVTDGGVGDDRAEAITAKFPDQDLTPHSFPGYFQSQSPVDSCNLSQTHANQADPPPCPPSTASRRRALLQCFLF